MDTYLFNLVEQVESRRSVELFLEIGDCYCYGRHTDVNVENALYYYMQAANMGSSRGEFRVGMIYSKGCKQSSKIYQNSPESIPLLSLQNGTIRHKVYQSNSVCN